MIIAVTGGIAAGETSFCNFFAKKGFERLSLSDLLRDILKEEGIEPLRDNLRAKGEELREKYGKNAMAVMAWKQISKSLDKNWAVESLMFVEEADFFKEKGATIIGITAPEKLRFERAILRNREKLKDFNHFKLKDNKKRSAGIDDIIKRADIVIENDGTLKELEEIADSVFTFISSYHE